MTARHTVSFISIHSLRMEGDVPLLIEYMTSPISIHSLRMEGDIDHQKRHHRRKYFNPLPPHGGRQQCNKHISLVVWHFNPLPPHGGRLPFVVNPDGTVTFQSTPSAWRETDQVGIQLFRDGISIHSLRMEGDSDGF